MFYLRRPVVLYPCADEIGRDDRFDFYLTNARTAYGCAGISEQSVFGKLSDGAVTIETFGAAALRQALTASVSVPDVIFDCRSTTSIDGPAPTYRLAASAGLRMASPVMLVGQGGIESVQAMRFFSASTRTGIGAIVSSNWAIARSADPPFLVDMFAAAGLLSLRPFDGEQIHIHSIGLAREGCANEVATMRAVNLALSRCGSVVPSWIATSLRTTQIASQAFLPKQIIKFEGRNNRGPHFDHPDPLLALARHFETIPSHEPGLLVCAGNSGTVGAIILSKYKSEEIA